MSENHIINPSSFLPDLNPIEKELVRSPQWAGAFREKEKLLEQVGLDRLLELARQEKALQKRAGDPWVLGPDNRALTISGETYVAFEVIDEWWENHPFACGRVAFVCKGTDCDPPNGFPLLPSPLNLVFPSADLFVESLRREGLPVKLSDAHGHPIYPLFGVVGTEGELVEDEDDCLPRHIPFEDFGKSVESLVNDQSRIVAMVRYFVRRASEF